MKTKTETFKKFGPGVSCATIPAGLRVIEIQSGSTKGQYFLDEFPRDVFPRGSIARHDAEHYGITYTRDEVED